MEGIVNVNGSSWVDEGSEGVARVCLAFTPLGKSITHRVTTFCFYGHARRISCRACTRPRSRLLELSTSNDLIIHPSPRIDTLILIILVRSILTIYIKEKLIISSFSIFYEQFDMLDRELSWLEVGRKISEIQIRFSRSKTKMISMLIACESSMYRGSSHAL